MITLEIGKTATKVYNKTNNTSFSPKELCEKVLFPLLFKEGRPLLNLTNTQFGATNENKGSYEERWETFKKLVEKLDGVLDALKVYGGSAVWKYNETYQLLEQTTVYCINTYMDMNNEDRWYTWVGSAFGLCFGDYTMYVNDEHIIEDLWRSIFTYRNFINNNTNFKCRQLPTWNSRYIYENKLGDINTFREKYSEGKQELKIKSLDFISLCWVISKFYPNVRLIDICAIGQTNKTCGKIIFDIKDCNRIFEFYKQFCKDVQKEFKAIEYCNDFNVQKDIAIKAMSIGIIKANIFAPIYNEKDTNNKTIKNQNYYKYLKFIMTKEEQQLAEDFISSLQNETYKNNLHSQIKDICNSTTVKHFTDKMADLFDGKIERKPLYDEVMRYLTSTTRQNFTQFLSYAKYFNN